MHCAGGRKATDASHTCHAVVPSGARTHARLCTEWTHARTVCAQARTDAGTRAHTHAVSTRAHASTPLIDREAEGAHHTWLRALPPAARAARLQQCTVSSRGGSAVTVRVGVVGAAVCCTLAVVRWLLPVECSPLKRCTLRRASYVPRWLPRVAHSAMVCVRADARKQTHAIVALQRCPSERS